MDKLKQKQSQKVSVTVNVAHPKLRRKTKRRVRVPPRKGVLQSSYQQPLTRMIRYDVPYAVQSNIQSQSAVPTAPQEAAKNLIIDNPLLDAIESKIASANKPEPVAEPVKMTEDAPFGYKKDGSPYKRKPKGFVDLRYEPDIEDVTTQTLFEKIAKKKDK